MQELIDTGKIVNTHGIKGEVRIDPWCDSPETMLTFKKLYLEDGTQLDIDYSRVHKNMVNCKFKNINSIDEALELINKVVFIKRDDMKLPEGVYYIRDLIGLKVIDFETKEEYGTLTEVRNTGSNDIYTVLMPNGREILFPVIKGVVAEVDIKGGIMKVRPPKGLLDI